MKPVRLSTTACQLLALQIISFQKRKEIRSASPASELSVLKRAGNAVALPRTIRCRISHLYTNPAHNTSSFALRRTHAGTKIATYRASHRASRAPVAAEDIIASRRARQQSYTDNSCDACNTCGLSIQSRPSFCQVAATFLAREAHLPSPIRELSEVQVRSRATVVTIPPCERTRLIPAASAACPGAAVIASLIA